MTVRPDVRLPDASTKAAKPEGRRFWITRAGSPAGYAGLDIADNWLYPPLHRRLIQALVPIVGGEVIAIIGPDHVNTGARTRSRAV